MSSVLKRRRLLRLVLDTSVIVAALRSRNGASRRMLELLVDGSFVMIATPALFLEYESVLRRPEHSVVHGQSEAETDLFIATLARYTELVRINFNWRPQLADANDVFVLEAAITVPLTL